MTRGTTTPDPPDDDDDGAPTDTPAPVPMLPGDSPGWFGYIAVGIALTSMALGLLVIGWLVVTILRRLTGN